MTHVTTVKPKHKPPTEVSNKPTPSIDIIKDKRFSERKSLSTEYELQVRKIPSQEIFNK